MAADDAEVRWLGVIGRSLAYLCLKNSNVASASLTEQAAFLEKLGLELDDQAGVIGSTPASLRELLRQARKKKGKGKRNGKSKGRH